MRTRLRLFLDWGITFEKKGYQVPDKGARKVAYANKKMLINAIRKKHPPAKKDTLPTGDDSGKSAGNTPETEKTGTSMQPTQAKGEVRHSTYNVRKEGSL